ncbi:MAG: nicotinate phosphoribosyltransferase [Desulfobacteraceae bacterium]|nr:nicotinate phosphoribosyltransferase [Desulfobacteraceae bacterium]MDH3572289.1 nicotinate phosphoribosyltransferase [Desulfobacteraceae bacterium]MDH3720277.1 nicotinate phosphoribosyltransferase [Desulfobacteraceae bacterium]MDH3835455.1 nicotinate phosphoribosyltransferase [Desulfobacteraceae bacterium]MDH3873207.1 nicotinate phosphoribosyltransferase [Desulfobacteraceae bacterium]
MTEHHRAGPLFTDLYELTMAASYFAHQVFDTATFSLYIRDVYATRNFFVAAGLDQVLDELASFRFSDPDISYLHSTGRFSKHFLDYLRQLRFTGDVYAMPEGMVFFANEPVMEVTAPIVEAQLIETFVLNTIGFQTMIASKAARCFHAAEGRPLIDFSLRRTQGQDAGIKVARSTFIAGFAATSNVLAGKIYGIPISGTMAHSYVSAFDKELDAFFAYADTFPDHSIFLIDTYDSVEGARHAAAVAKEMQKKGHTLIGVRLDSGDMAGLSREVRKIFDDAGLYDVKIFASSGFDEFKIAKVISEGALIDAFGVGTKVGVSADAPFVDVVYKMVRFKGRDVRKLSPGKVTLAGEKQVFRKSDQNGRYSEDIIGQRDEIIAEGKPLLEKVMGNGKILRSHPQLQMLQEKFKENFAALDDRYKSIQDHNAYPVKLSRRIQDLQKR